MEATPHIYTTKESKTMVGIVGVTIWWLLVILWHS